MTKTEVIHLRFIISGRVQGVWYRKHAKEKADELGVLGNVKNLKDGTVELMAQGEASLVNTLLKWCRKGPPLAHVERVTTEELPLATYKGFKILK